MKKIILVGALLLSLTISAQYSRRDGNRIGISAGVTQASLTTTNFHVKPELGWIAGFGVRGNYYNDFSMIFGMQFMESNFSVSTYNSVNQIEDVNYKLMGAQIRLLLSYNVIQNYVSIDIGPVLQVNDKLKISAKDQDNIIPGTLLTAKDIVDVTKVNGNLYMGISAGNKRIRAVFSYQYGLNNFLNHLNSKEDLKLLNENKEFKGHLGILSGQLLFNL
ncbi:MAG: PorT family protein [Flavobacterium sp.]